MKNFFENIPNYIINAITVVSFVFVLFPFLIELILIYFNKLTVTGINLINVVVLMILILILLIRIIKYHQLLKHRMKIVSEEFAGFLNASQSIYFQIMKSHKNKELTIEWLTDTYQKQMILILNNLSEIMQIYTGREVSACIKLINFDEIDLKNATVTTFCRSQKSMFRDEYNDSVLIKDNTDFKDIVDPETNKNYFYCGNLIKYDKELRKSGKKYKNTNDNYSDYYIGTIVVPICIKNNKLYDTNNEPNKYNIIGFLCVDSLAKDAFTDAQEKYNYNIVKAFADNIYVLLGQYAHYLKGFTRDKAVG